MCAIAVQTHELSKCYEIGTRRRAHDTLRESMVSASRAAASKVGRRRGSATEGTLWALREVSLEINDGEILGLIGHNGAGKSTLLKILSRITEPSAGWADVTGRVGSLLEVGTGFHPDLTGRENVYLNGSILGMSKVEIRRRFDEIVAFAEVERFLETPVKRYSSGMAVRLAFAVAAHLEPDILLVDEVLAVGDAAFQRKSLGKMGEVAGAGRTVIFVSHNLAIIQALCQRGVLLEHGTVIADGPIADTVGGYLSMLERHSSTDLLARPDRDGRGRRETLIRSVELTPAHGGARTAVIVGDPVVITVQVTEPMPVLGCNLTIVNALGQPVTAFNSHMSSPLDTYDEVRHTEMACEVDSLALVPGRYRVDVLVWSSSGWEDGLQAATYFDVEPGLVDERPVNLSGWDGNVVLSHKWRLPS
jgi:lipopolysaccharide transport system ATP-binding protein